MKGKRVVWKTTAIPEDLYKMVESLARSHGYTSVSEFVKDAVRRRLEEIGELVPSQPVIEVSAGGLPSSKEAASS